MGKYTRRSILVGLTAVAAGCSGQSDHGTTTDMRTRTPTVTPTDTATEIETPTVTEEPTKTDDPVQVREWPDEYYQGPLVSAHEHMHGRDRYSVIREDAQRFIDWMDRNKVDQVVAIASDRYIDQVKEYDDRLIPFAFAWAEMRGDLNAVADKLKQRLEQHPVYAGLGEIGLSGGPRIGGEERQTEKPVLADHPGMLEVWKLAAERDIPVITYAAQPWAYPERQAKEFESPEDIPSWEALDRALAQNRETDFIVHGTYSWHKMNDGQLIADKLEQHPNMVIDITGMYPRPSSQEYTEDKFQAMLEKQGGIEGVVADYYTEHQAILEKYSDRVMWGMDAGVEWTYSEWALNTWVDIGRALLGKLPEENARNIGYRTAEDTFGITVPEGEY